jgi:uncharacterized protein (TIGR02145 family)
MKALTKCLFFLVVVSAVSLVSQCTGIAPVNSSCGKGTSTEVASGALWEPGGEVPAQGASVFMRPRDCLAQIQPMGKRTAKSAFFTRQKYTDSAGKYRFTTDDSIPRGMYCIEGRDSNNNCMLIDSVEIGKGIDVHTFIDTLKPPAVIQGKIPAYSDSLEVLVRVFGLDAYAKARPGGGVSLDNLPQGNLRLHILFSRGSERSCDTVTLVTRAGDTATLENWVIFDSRGGNMVVPQMVNYGKHLAQPSSPISAGCIFAGWFKEPECQNEWQFALETFMAPLTLYAKWIVRDIDGNVYTTVKIGNQVWLTQNLKTTKYNDGASIPQAPADSAWIIMDTPSYCWYGNDSAAYKAAYGALYNWHTVNTGKLAPAGWHVSTDAEWDTLENYLLFHGYTWDGTTDSTIGKALAAKAYWDTSDFKGAIGNDLTKNNSSGFSALPGGSRNEAGNSYNNSYYGDIGKKGSWWSTGQINEAEAGNRSMSADGSAVDRSQKYKFYSFSVRCVRD